ncbi:MAG TPA: PqqD family protein [Candidatus Binataceae bacterium]
MIQNGDGSDAGTRTRSSRTRGIDQNRMSEKYIKPSRNTAARMLDDEMIVMSVRDSRVYTLNATASAIWSAADGATPLREIVASKVVPNFEVDPDVAYQDALELVDELAQEGILLVADAPIPQEAV